MILLHVAGMVSLLITVSLALDPVGFKSSLPWEREQVRHLGRNGLRSPGASLPTIPNREDGQLGRLCADYPSRDSIQARGFVAGHGSQYTTEVDGLTKQRKREQTAYFDFLSHCYLTLNLNHVLQNATILVSDL